MKKNVELILERKRCDIFDTFVRKGSRGASIDDAVLFLRHFRLPLLR